MSRARCAAIALTAAAILGAGIARAEVVGGDNFRASFNGWLTPRALPRSGAAPVALHMKGNFTTSNGRQPPQLRRVTIAINRNGTVFSRGLPVCRQRSIRSTTTRQALDACGAALVGRGRFAAHVAIPTLSPFPARGTLLAFNAKVNGRPAILAHIYGTVPVPTTRLLLLTYRRADHGTFGTTLSVKMPRLKAGWGYVTGFRLTLHRSYAYRGRRRSFLSASCPAPRGIHAVLFVAAQGTYYLADGRKLTRVLEGTCSVRG